MSCTENKCQSEEGKKCCGKLRLHYFNGRGRAELIRWILTVGKADWEDIRYTSEEWKAEVKCKMPNGQLPVLEQKGKDDKSCFITQSSTIARASAHWFCLAGKSSCEAVEADEAYEVLRDLAEAGAKAYFEQDAQKKETLMKQLKEELTPKNLGFLEKKLQANGGKFIAGGQCFTYADLAIAQYFNNLRAMNLAPCEEECAKQTPGLHALAKSVEEIPELKDYLAKRAATQF